MAAGWALLWMAGAASASAAEGWKVRLLPDAVAAEAAPAQKEAAPAGSGSEARQPGWKVRMAGERDAGRAGGKAARGKVARAPMSDAEAAALLDYRLPARVEAGMRARLRKHPNDARAWGFLARALAAQGRLREAADARAHARRLGGSAGSGAGAARPWHLRLALSAFADSNVVIAPDALHLAARDRGDIGARVALHAGGRALARKAGFLDWRLGYDDMVLQDFNVYALRLLSGAARAHWRYSETGAIWLGAGAQQATLGNRSLFAGWDALAGLRWARSRQDELRVDARWGRRNFAGGFGGFSAWRWQARHAWRHRADALEAEAGFRVAGERTRQQEEAWRLFGLFASAQARIRRLGDGWLWLGGGLRVDARRYRTLDARPFLRAPLKRRDLESAAFVLAEWRRGHTLWGASAAESWFVRAGARQNRSNMDAGAVFDPAQSRQWKRWRIEGGVEWRY